MSNASVITSCTDKTKVGQICQLLILIGYQGSRYSQEQANSHNNLQMWIDYMLKVNLEQGFQVVREIKLQGTRI